VHESVFTGENSLPVDPGQDDEHPTPEWLTDPEFVSTLFEKPSDDERRKVDELLTQHGINILPYKTNAELSVLSSAFLDDNERNLLFRIYVPSGRLYAAEADKLLTLFRDWLGQVGRYSVRQDGYATDAGHVYEFFGGSPSGSLEISQDFADFSSFLNMCVDNPEAATERVVLAGLEQMAGVQLVARYGKEARRLKTDVRHAYEMRVLTLRQQLESELMDAGEPNLTQQVEALIERLASPPAEISPGQILAGSRNAAGNTSITINMNSQLFDRFEGTVVQNIQGTVHLNPNAKELLSLIEMYGGSQSTELVSAVHEMEDTQARPEERLEARQRIKVFLTRLGGKLGESALSVLQAYVENKIGL
jgi:hypothetical protein